MAGAYQEIPIGRSYSFTSNVASRLSALGVNGVNANFYFMVKDDPMSNADADAVLTATPTFNTSTNIATVSLNVAVTEDLPERNTSFWEISMLTEGGTGYYTLDHGRAAIVRPVRRG